MKTVLVAAALLVLTIATAPASFAAPTLKVSASTGLTDGQKIDISGSGFAANMSSIAVGQCVKGYTGPGDCNLQGGATFRNADGSGSIGSFSIVVKEKFGSTDCTKVECVIAAAPLPTAVDAATVKANEYIIPITFGGAAAPAQEPASAPSDGATAAPAIDEIPKTGVGDSVPLILLAGGALLVVGGVLRFGTRRAGDLA